MPVITKQELEDAAADALSFEKVVNGTPTEGGTGVVTTRLGQQIKTLSKSIREVTVAGTVFPTTAAGLAATLLDGYFSVPDSADGYYLVLYQNQAGSAVPLKRYPSVEVIDQMQRDAEDFKSELGALSGGGFAEFIGSEDVIPLITDRNLRVILGYSKSKQSLVSLDFGKEATRVVFGDLSFSQYVGDGDIYPLMTDNQNRVLLGYSAVQDKIVGAGITDLTGISGQTGEEPLPEALSPAALNHIIAYGQSLSVGAQGRPPLSTSQPYSNVTFQGGPRAYNGTAFVWAPLKPLVEDQVAPAPDGLTNRGETICSGAANYATTLRALDGYLPSEHPIMASSAGYGGASISFLEKGNSWYANTFLNHITQAHTLNANHKVQAMMWMQGENDGGSMTQATYFQKLNKLVGDVETDAKAITGQTSPVYTLLYQTCTNSAAWRQIQKAQLDVAKTNPKAFLVTPLYHIPHVSDAVHLSALGYKWVGAYFGRAYKKLLEGKQPKWLDPVSATLRGTELRVRFSVPYRPLVLDQITLAPTQNYGFRVQTTADDVAVAINQVYVDGDYVVLILASAPSGAATVRYAMDYLGTGLNIVSAGSGNVRDSEPSKINISGQEYPLYNVAPHFELPIITVGE